MKGIPDKFTVGTPKSGFKNGLGYDGPSKGYTSVPSGTNGVKTLAQAKSLIKGQNS